MTKRRKSEPPAAPLEIMADCKEAIVDYLTRAFPTRQMEEYKDELGDVRSRPMWDGSVSTDIRDAARSGWRRCRFRR